MSNISFSLVLHQFHKIFISVLLPLLKRFFNHLINLFVNSFRKEQEIAKEKKPSVLQKLNEAKTDLPKKSPGKAKEAEL